ncbi:prolyl hydroxylase family protein [Rhizorhapis sp. SPR117]|uniref:prolyl hydroxylase family protein n=1 Tax=Rhizorhapis sp. SPR117 TaxID=2912611 RepID=UPI001F22A333|nr:2OG-Fe(II) oxygenase [Rhizorhapis sp. SPR117]
MIYATNASPARLMQHPGIQRFPDPALTLFIKRDFLNPQECNEVIARIDSRRRPSTIADANGDPNYRTSETCDLDPTDPFVAAIDQKICAFAGIDPAHGEPIQGQRYDVGQEFKAHTDYFELNGADYVKYCSVAGQRTWTFMIYLNIPEAGGATRFRSVNKIIHAEKGKLLCWNNIDETGKPNPATIHHGMKVRKGVKYIITKWYRERVWK